MRPYLPNPEIEIRKLAASLRLQLIQEIREKRDEVNRIKGWPFHITRHSQSKVEYALNESPIARSWRIFSLALKGLTPQQKLFHLRKHYRFLLESYPSHHSAFVQVDDYIQMMIRQGELNADGTIR